MRKRRLMQRVCNKKFLLGFPVIVFTLFVVVQLVERCRETILSPKGRFHSSGLEGLRDRVQQSTLVERFPNQECKIPRYDPTSKLHPDVACKRVKPLRDSCKKANDLFFSEPTDTCPQQDVYEICEIKDVKEKSVVKCSNSICKNSIVMGTIDAGQGILVWTKVPDIAELEAHIQTLVEKPNFGFCFVKCSLEEEDKVVIQEKEGVNEEKRNLSGSLHADQAKQMLLLPPQMNTFDLPHNSSRNPVNVNVNVILLDSVSHSHFLRSMPETVQTLKKIQTQKAGHVFSYNLAQSLKGRTYETERALFSGEIYEPKKPFEVHDMPSDPIHSEVLLKRYKRGGYETMWTEDLCWLWEWGIVKNLAAHVPKEKTYVRWKRLQHALRRAGIDRYDMSLSSCEILKLHGCKQPFLGPRVICYNGKHQHHYILSYLAELQKKTQKDEKPFFHYTEINVAHEYYGRRIQTLDEDLAQYLHSISTLDNMITILYADHGNSYGKYFEKSDEARTEMYHPALTILASKNIQEVLGKRKMHALVVNQERLVSILDLHYALQTLTPEGSVAIQTEHVQYDVEPEGLLSPINPNRTCNSIPRIQPNVCICEGFDSYVSNDTRQMMVAEFALGEINNAIQSQFRAAHPLAMTGFGSCQRLVATWFGNVKENYNKDTVITKLDLHVAGKNTGQGKDVFFVIVEMSWTKSYLMSLLSYERVSIYRKYRACADKSVNLKLCICSLIRPITKPDYTEIPTWHIDYPFIFGHKSSLQNVDNCLFIFERKTKAGITLEASVECPKRKYITDVDVNVILNVHTSQPIPARARVYHGEMAFLIVFMQTKANVEWNVEYSIKFEQVV